MVRIWHLKFSIMEETIITYKTKYTLLSQADYLILNEKISEAMSFELGDATARYTTIQPTITDTGLSVMIVTAEVQEKYPQLIVGLELIDSYITAEVQPTEISVEGLNPEQVVWVEEHAQATGVEIKEVI